MSRFPTQFIRDKVENFTDLKHLTEYAKNKNGDKPYFSYKESSEVVRNVSFNQMHGYINKLGTAFAQIGIMGKNIAILSETRYEWIVSYLATVNGNGTVVPLDKEVAPDQLIKFIERAGVSCVIYSKDFAEFIEGYANDGAEKSAQFFVNMDLAENKSDSILAWQGLIKMGEGLLEGGSADFTGAQIDRDKACAYLFTSGTTGTSKCVMLTHRNIASNAYCAACSVAFSSGDVIVSVLPAHHTYETTCTFLATFALGINICQNESLKAVMRNFAFYKPTKLVLVPLFIDNMVKKIWDEIDKKGKRKTVERAIAVSNGLRKVGIDLRRTLFKDVINAFGGRLEGMISGGAPLNPEHIRTLDNFGLSVWQGYGTTECAPLISVVPSDMYMKKIGSVGHFIFSNEVKIDGKDENGYGEILAKGENVMLGYLDDEQATREVFTEDGFYKTGDIGYIDEDGYIYVTGRKKNIIILSNGKNIYPEEIEEYLQKIEGIKECAIVGRNSGGAENITALIVPDMEKFEGKSFTDVEQLMKDAVDEINKQLPVFKQITETDVREQEFEKTASRKIKRHLLK